MLVTVRGCHWRFSPRWRRGSRSERHTSLRHTRAGGYPLVRGLVLIGIISMFRLAQLGVAGGVDSRLRGNDGGVIWRREKPRCGPAWECRGWCVGNESGHLQRHAETRDDTHRVYRMPQQHTRRHTRAGGYPPMRGLAQFGSVARSIQCNSKSPAGWIPAFAGMTVVRFGGVRSHAAGLRGNDGSWVFRSG